MKSAVNTGLESLALALLVMPDPFTTIAGVGLLAYTQTTKQRRPTGLRRLKSTFQDYYTYRMDMKDGMTITFQMFPTRQGQLPNSYPKIAKLHDDPQVVKALRQKAPPQSKAGHAPFSKVEPAGLLRPPKPKGRAELTTRYASTSR
jgi:hypothetical protein